MHRRFFWLFLLFGALGAFFLHIPVSGAQENSQEESASKAFTPEEAQMHIAELKNKLLEARSHQRASFLCRELLLLKPASIQPLREVIRTPRLSIEVKDIVIQHLLNADVPEIAPDALSYLGSEETTYRRLAAEALGKIKDPSTVPALGKALERETTPVVKNVILTALSAFKDQKTLPYFLASLRDPDGSVRSQAIAGLASLTEKESVPQLWNLMEDEYAGNALDAAKAITEKKGIQEKKLKDFFEDEDMRHKIFAFLMAPRVIPEPARFFSEKKNREKLEKAVASSTPQLRSAALNCARDAFSMTCGFVTDSSVLRLVAGAYAGEQRAANRDLILQILFNASMKCFPAEIQEDGSMTLLDAPLVRFIHYDTDTITMPVFLHALNDKLLPTRMTALNMLRGSTGYFYGFSGLYALDEIEITPSLITSWNDWWKEHAGKNPPEKTSSQVDALLQELDTRYDDSKALLLFDALKLLAGRDFGFVKDSKLEDKAETMRKFRTWWATNRGKSPLVWMVDTLKENGVENLSIPTRRLLAVMGGNCFDGRLYNLPMDEEGIKKLNQEIINWYENNKKQELQ